jgi:hypothetical protein
MGKGNAHVSQTFDFDKLVSEAIRYGAWYHEELDKSFGAVEFTGRDINGAWAMVYQDGEQSVCVDSNHMSYENVTINHLRAHLEEMGFQVGGSLWKKQVLLMRDEPPLPENPGYIYLLRMDGTNYYKIGKSKNVVQRMKQIGLLMPKPVTLICQGFFRYMDRYEASIHQDYAVFHSHGEWFDLNDQEAEKLADFLRAMHREPTK